MLFLWVKARRVLYGDTYADHLLVSASGSGAEDSRLVSPPTLLLVILQRAIKKGTMIATAEISVVQND